MAPLALLTVALLAGSGCRKRDENSAKKEPEGARPWAPTSASAPAPSAPAPSASAPPPAPSGPVDMAPEVFTVPGLEPSPWRSSIFPIEGALMVVRKQEVGRIVGESVEWIGKIPREVPNIGENYVTHVAGSWPDGVDVLYQNSSGRAPIPTYQALTGKGGHRVVGEGGSPGSIHGLARLGPSTVMAYSNMEGDVYETVRGPQVPRAPTLAKHFGCTKEELSFRWEWPGQRRALSVHAVAATRAGELVALGRLCEDRAVALEVWDTAGKPRIIPIEGWKSAYGVELLPDGGESLFLFAGSGDTLLRYRDGKLSPVPSPGRSISRFFVSDQGQPHALVERTILRLDGEQWTPVVRLPWEESFRSLFLRDGVFWGHGAGGIFRLKPSESVEMKEGCTTPFVYLYRVSEKNDRKFTFPSTRKALSSFAEVEQLTLVEFHEAGGWRLGLKTASKEQAEAVVAHLRSTMKDEKPELRCYEPRNPRVIPVKKP